MNTREELRIGDRVRVAATTETMILIAIDGEQAWLRYDEGLHKTERLEDLEFAHSNGWYQLAAERLASISKGA